MTDDERKVALAALRAYEFETKFNLQGMRSTSMHDPCCEADAGRRKAMNDMADALEERLALIRSAMSTLE